MTEKAKTFNLNFGHCRLKYKMIYIIVAIHACFPNNWEWYLTPQPFSTYNSLNDRYLGCVLSVNQLNQGASQILWWDADTNEKSVQSEPMSDLSLK